MTRKKTTTKEMSVMTAESNSKLSKKDQIRSIVKRQKNKFLTESQKEYYDKLYNNQITICSGPAGVGKSYIAMKAAVERIASPVRPKSNDHRSKVRTAGRNTRAAEEFKRACVQHGTV